MGFEPTTLGTTILYSNRLSYIHRVICFPNRVQIYTLFSILQNFCKTFSANLCYLLKIVSQSLSEWLIYLLEEGGEADACLEELCFDDRGVVCYIVV